MPPLTKLKLLTEVEENLIEEGLEGFTSLSEAITGQ
jgi:hypothetical protein